VELEFRPCTSLSANGDDDAQVRAVEPVKLGDVASSKAGDEQVTRLAAANGSP